LLETSKAVYGRRGAGVLPLESEVVMTGDAAEVAPNVYKVLFENDRVRLLEAHLKPGDSSALHSHPDYLVYNLDDGKVRFGGPSGEGEEVELKAGEVMWRDAEEHTAEGVGASDVRALLFELK
jgi:quercetin dioxygenase-like cupin family protein